MSAPGAMPFRTRMTIRKKYPGFEPQDMTEYISRSVHCYYFLLKKHQGRQVTWLRVRMSLPGRSTVIRRLRQKAA